MTNTRQNASQMSIWKENLLKVKAEKEAKEKAKEDRIKELMKSGEMYKNMVSDTVEVITQQITKATKDSYTPLFEEDGLVRINVFEVLTITPDLCLYTGCWPLPTNPETGKQCFGETYQFEDEEQIKKFFDEVMSRLPADVQIRERVNSPKSNFFEERIFDVLVEIKLN